MDQLIKEFKAGDIVSFHGALFRILSDAIKSETHPDTNGGVYCARGEWVAGNIVGGYFGPSKDWLFQGNDLAGKYHVEAPKVVRAYQPHAITGASLCLDINAGADTGYYLTRDSGALDAPQFLPAGCTGTNTYEGREYVIGWITARG